MAQPLCVLMVEDSIEDTEILLRELRRGGFDPVHDRVDTPEAMKAALAARRYDLVISDYSLPAFNAPDALKVLKASGQDIPFFVVSGSIGEDLAVDLMNAGAHDYIMKGNLKRLLPSVVRQLNDAAARREHRLAEEKLRQSEERLRMAITAARMYTWDWDVKTGALVRSGHYVDVHGAELPAGQNAYQSLLGTIHPEDRERFERIVSYSLQSGAPCRMDFRIQRNGEVRWLETQAQPYADSNGKPVRMIGVTHDITERKRTEQLVRELAFFDPLTSLPNRNSLRDRVMEKIRKDDGRGDPFALLLMDLNHFKDINDTLGHHRGDMVLKEVAKRLQSFLKPPAVAARLGGDEFAILLPDLDRKGDVPKVIEEIQRVLHAPVVIDDLAIAVEAGIGVSLYPEHGTNPESLLRRADIAMYAAKKAGVSHVVYDTKDDHHSTARLALMAELRHAIEHDRLTLHYQPKINLKTGKACGAEALVRWMHPRRGMVPPDQFIMAAEQSGMIHPLTLWVLQAAMRQSEQWRLQGFELPVAVNISARNLFDPELPEEINQLLQRHRLEPESLSLEITESAIMADPSRAEQILRQLRAVGLRLSIDDFGIGYSSFGYLSRLTVNSLKVDKSFVSRMMQSPNDAVIVRSTIDLAHNLGLEVVAEGVEDETTYESLRQWGCDTAQGYFMSKPLPEEEFTRWLLESPRGFR